MRWFSIETAARIIGTGSTTVMVISRNGHIRRRGGSVLLPVGCWDPAWLKRALKLAVGGW